MVCSWAGDDYLPRFDKMSDLNVGMVSSLETFILSSRSSILLQSSTHRSLEKQAEHGEAARQPRSRHWEEGQGEGAVPPLCFCPLLVSVPLMYIHIFFSFQIHESSPLDLASEESERLPCLLTLLDMGAYVNAGDKHSELVLLGSISPFWCSFVDFEISSSEGKTPLLHALASSDGLTVHNTENIQLLLQRGPDCEHSAYRSSDCLEKGSAGIFKCHTKIFLLINQHDLLLTPNNGTASIRYTHGPHLTKKNKKNNTKRE